LIWHQFPSFWIQYETSRKILGLMLLISILCFVLPEQYISDFKIHIQPFFMTLAWREMKLIELKYIYLNGLLYLHFFAVWDDFLASVFCLVLIDSMALLYMAYQIEKKYISKSYLLKSKPKWFETIILLQIVLKPQCKFKRSLHVIFGNDMSNVEVS